MTHFTIIPASRSMLPGEPFRGRNFINGKWQDSADRKTFDRVSPSQLDEFLEVKTLTMRIGRTRAPWVKPV